MVIFNIFNRNTIAGPDRELSAFTPPFGFGGHLQND